MSQENSPIIDEKLANNIAKCNIQEKIISAFEVSDSGLGLPTCIPGAITLSSPMNRGSCDISVSDNCLSNKNMSMNSSSNINITDVCSGVQKLSVTIPVDNSNLPTFPTKFGNGILSNLFPLPNDSCTQNILEISNVNNSSNKPVVAQCSLDGNSYITKKPNLTNDLVFPSSHVTLNIIENESTLLRETSPNMIVTRKRQYRLLKKSPHKTSPLKKVSPILRQQFRRYKCKATSPRKLKFILPKQMRKKPRALLSKSVLPETCNPVNSNLRTSVHGSSGNCNIIQFCHNDLGTDSYSFADAEKSMDPCNVTSISPNNAILSDQSLLDQVQDEVLESEVEDSNADQLLQLQEEHLAAFLKASSTIAMQRGGKKKNLSGLNKQQKVLQEKITALSYSPDLKSQENDLVMSYLIRVRKALTSKDPKIFTDFVALFNNYSSATDSPENLYFNVCGLLNGFSELKEEFVMFLTPDQAVKVGKFQEYCIFARMREFIDELKYHSSRQVQNFAKIFKTFQTLNNRPNISQEEFFDVLTPILRFQPHLIESLNRLLPTSQPLESLPDDFEVINMEDEKVEKPEDFEVINMMDSDAKILTDNCFCRCHTVSVSSNSNAQSSQQAKMEHCVSCGLRFIDGRVYLQYGKSLRPTKIIYSTNEKKEMEDNGSSDPQNKPKVHRKLKDPSNKPVKSKSKNRSRRIKLCTSTSSDPSGKSKKGKSSKRKFSKVQK